MCRLMALTFTDRRLQRFKADILDRMLLMSQTDDNQSDGWGITDGQHLVKSQAMYSVSLPNWKTSFDPSLAWLAHIRKASSATGRTINESHPYYFEMADGTGLYAAHNGFIHGTNWNIDRQAGVKSAPNTDSWRAFCQLWLDMLEMEQVDGFADIIPNLIENWTPNFEDNSQFAMLFHWRGNVIALRHDRPLHCMRVGNGHIVHTSVEFLRILRENLKWQYNLDPEEPKYIDKDNMVIFQPGHGDITVHKLDLKFKPRTTYVYTAPAAAWQGHGGPHAGNAQTANTTEAANPSASSNANVNEKNGSVGSKDIYSRPVTRPRPRAPITNKEADTQQQRPVLYLPDGSHTSVKPPVEKSRKDDMLPSKVALWRAMLKDFIPLRNNLCTFWAITSLGYRNVLPGGFLPTASLADLRMFQSMVCKLPIFTERQNILINAWNHLVKRGVDRELHELWCDSAFFWMNPRYNRVGDEHLQAVSRFQSDLIGFVFHLDIDPTLYLRLDREKLEQILDTASSIRITNLQLGAD